MVTGLGVMTSRTRNLADTKGCYSRFQHVGTVLGKMPPQMNIVLRQVGDITIIDLQGNIMFEDGDLELRTAVARALESGGKKLLLNMAEVPYMDSAGLSELVRCFVAIGKRGGRLGLFDLTRKVNDLLTIAKLLTVFETFDSEAEAVKSFGS